MIYAYIIAALSIFGAGFALSHQLDKAEVQSLQMAIERGNAESEMTLNLAKAKVEAAAKEAAIANQQLESSHDQNIRTINSYRDKLATVSLRDPGKSHSRCASAENSDTGIHQEDGASEDRLSREATEFLWSEASAAAIAATERNALLTFIKEQNCGVGR